MKYDNEKSQISSKSIVTLKVDFLYIVTMIPIKKTLNNKWLGFAKKLSANKNTSPNHNQSSFFLSKITLLFLDFISILSIFNNPLISSLVFFLLGPHYSFLLKQTP